MSLGRIRAALELRLADWANANKLPVAWQNAPTSLPNGEHARAYLLPAHTASLDLAGAHRGWRGVFQVSLFCLPGVGVGRAELLAQSLDEMFPVGLAIWHKSLLVRMVSPMSARPAVNEVNWLHVPVEGSYAADDVVN